MNNQSIHVPSCITYFPSSGRFGDNLLIYLHAKWLSYCYDMPLLCVHQSFPYVTQLNLYENEIDHTKVPHPHFMVHLNSKCREPKKSGSVAYVVPYFTESKWENETIYTKWDCKNFKNNNLFFVNWNDLDFRKIAMEMISPRLTLPLTRPPKNTISIAIHVREGGTFDPDDCRFQNPIKLPPLSYYSNCLTKILKLLPQGKPVHCQIFTDAINPISIMKTISKSITNLPITFNCRKVRNHDRINVLEDFFSLFHYDILIRPASNYSIIPSLLHDYAIVASPCSATLHTESNSKLITVDKINLQIHDELYSLLFTR